MVRTQEEGRNAVSMLLKRLVFRTKENRKEHFRKNENRRKFTRNKYLKKQKRSKLKIQIITF